MPYSSSFRQGQLPRGDDSRGLREGRDAAEARDLRDARDSSSGRLGGRFGERRGERRDEARINPEALLLELQVHEFQAIDWMLQRDVHPGDERSMARYREHAARDRELIKMYVETVGPIIWMDPLWAGGRPETPWA